MSNYTTINKKYETIFFPRIEKAIRKKFDETIAVVKSSGVQAAITSLNNKLTNPELAKEIQRLYKSVGVRHAELTRRDLKQKEKGSRKSFDDFETKAFTQTWIEWILGYLRKHLIEKVLYNVNTTTRDHLLKVLFKSISEGMGIDETVELIEKDKFSESQAARIVRTEVNASANAGVLAAGETYEYQMQKEWVAVNDHRTRDDEHASHVLLDGTVIDFEAEFKDPVNGDRLKAPGDPSASAASIINCRCQLTLKPKRDVRGRLIPKRQNVFAL